MATYKRRRHARHGRRVGSNPGSILSSVKQGYTLPALKTTGVMAAGAVINVMLQSKIGSTVPFLGGKLTNVALGIATAGAMLMVPKVGRDLFAGAMTGTLIKAVKDTGALAKFGLNGIDELYNTGNPHSQLRELLMNELQFAN